MSDYWNKQPIPADPLHRLQATTFHLGIVRDVKDPEGRGRVRVECPTLNGTGKENWLNWAEVCGTQISSTHKKGDHGIWWPLMPGQAVFVGFKDGSYFQPFVIPGPPWGEEPKPNKGWIPKEVAAANQESVRDGTRVRVIKSEAGHSIIMDDRGGKEMFALLSWTGAGHVWLEPGKDKDEEEKEGSESKPRKGKTRGDKFAFAQNSDKPSDLVDGGASILATLDLNGQGLMQIAQDDNGVVFIYAAKGMGQMGPYLALDSGNDVAMLGCGNAQIRCDGASGNIYTTRQIIQEQQPIPVKGFFDSVWKSLKGVFEAFSDSGDSSGGASGGSGGSGNAGGGGLAV